MSKIAKKEMVRDEAGLVIGFRFTFADKKVLEGRLDEVHEKVDPDLRAHGCLAKIGDSYSGKKTVREAREAAEATWAALKEGIWARRGGGGMTPILYEAIARVTGETIEAVQGKYASLTPDDRKAAEKRLRKRLDVSRAIKEIELERLMAEEAEEEEPLVL